MDTNKSKLQRILDSHNVAATNTAPLTLRCLDCTDEWPAPVGPAGNPVGFFWLCPSNCNMAERPALRIVGEPEEHAPDRVVAAEIKLASILRPKRRDTVEWQMRHEARMAEALLAKAEEYADRIETDELTEQFLDALNRD